MQRERILRGLVVAGIGLFLVVGAAFGADEPSETSRPGDSGDRGHGSGDGGAHG